MTHIDCALTVRARVVTMSIRVDDAKVRHRYRKGLV